MGTGAALTGQLQYKAADVNRDRWGVNCNPISLDDSCRQSVIITVSLASYPVVNNSLTMVSTNKSRKNGVNDGGTDVKLYKYKAQVFPRC